MRLKFQKRVLQYAIKGVKFIIMQAEEFKFQNVSRL
jgi:hypothetical protein